MNGGNYYEYKGGEFAPKVHDEFSGAIYENEHMMTDNNPYRFETTEVKLRGAVLLVTVQDALIGDSANQRYPKAAGSTLSVDGIDVSSMYFKNATAGLNTKINIVGVRI